MEPDLIVAVDLASRSLSTGHELDFEVDPSDTHGGRPGDTVLVRGLGGTVEMDGVLLIEGGKFIVRCFKSTTRVLEADTPPPPEGGSPPEGCWLGVKGTDPDFYGVPAAVPVASDEDPGDEGGYDDGEERLLPGQRAEATQGAGPDEGDQGSVSGLHEGSGEPDEAGPERGQRQSPGGDQYVRPEDRQPAARPGPAAAPAAGRRPAQG